MAEATEDTLVRRFEETRTQDGYSILFAYTNSNPFTVVVKYEGAHVATSSQFTSHPRAARWARKKIREHRRALAILRSA